MKKRRLFTPGPTPLIPAAQQALAAPLLHHRTDEFKVLLKQASSHLQQLFRTSDPVVILTSSGTGAMEAVVCAFARPDGQALAVSAGKFGERWLEIAARHNLPCAALTRAWGETVIPAEVADAVAAADADVLFLQGCETSTGTSFDLKGIASAVRHQRPSTCIVVDAITAIGSQVVEMEKWGLDVVISGSQKGFSAPPGLAFVAASSRARQTLQERSSPEYYLDLGRELAGQEVGRTAFTPAVTLVAALEAAAAEMLAQGLDTVIAEAGQMAAAARAGLESLGFRLVSSRPANAVTAVFPPPGVDADNLRQRLDEDFGLKVAGGQGPLKRADYPDRSPWLL